MTGKGFNPLAQSPTPYRIVLTLMHTLWSRSGSEIVAAHIPSYNQAIVFPACQLNADRSVTRICPKMRVTLRFKISPKAARDIARDKLQCFLEKYNAFSIIHRDKKVLGVHLMNVFDILREAGQVIIPN